VLPHPEYELDVYAEVSVAGVVNVSPNPESVAAVEAVDIDGVSLVGNVYPPASTPVFVCSVGLKSKLSTGSGSGVNGVYPIPLSVAPAPVSLPNVGAFHVPLSKPTEGLGVVSISGTGALHEPTVGVAAPPCGSKVSIPPISLRSEPKPGSQHEPPVESSPSI